MLDPEETDPSSADPFGRRIRPKNGSGTFTEKDDRDDTGGRSHGFLSHICAQCAAENWIDPGWLVLVVWQHRAAITVARKLTINPPTAYR
jgi:hypothetical protein